MNQNPYNPYHVDIIPNSYDDIKNKLFKIVSKESIEVFNKKFDLKYLGTHDIIFSENLFTIYIRHDFNATNNLLNLFNKDINICVKL